MKFDVYCDESRPDAFTTKSENASRYLVIGSLWLRTEDRDQRKAELHALKDAGKIGGELKWGKVSHSRINAYQQLVDWFFDAGMGLRFRAIVVDRTKLDLVTFHAGDGELGFYKFYYQMLHHWISEQNDYAIFCDLKRNREQDRLPVLQRVLNQSNLTAQISSLQGIESKQSVLIQAADFFTGAVAAKFNNSVSEGSAKAEIIRGVESKIRQVIQHTPKSQAKFNVFKIKPRGGW